MKIQPELETQMSLHAFTWQRLAVVGTIVLLAGCAQTPAPSLVASNPPPVAPGPSAAWYHITFMTGSSTLGNQGALTVADITDVMQKNPGTIVTIIGKTDTVGSPNDNMHLSHQRADAVRDALVYHGNVAADRVDTRWTGETRQRVVTANQTAELSNRVVDIAVY
jgi:outer membrane protein OmpA-like peptidoglycan-associated protein